MKKIEKFSTEKKYSFGKNILASAIGTIISLVVFILVIIFISISLIITGSKELEKKIEPNSILKIKLNYPIYDSPNSEINPTNLLNNISAIDNTLNLYGVVSTIELASKNENISGILLQLDEFEGPIGWASLKEIRDALKNFKNTGKFIWSYSNILSQSAYYLASVSDSILIYPKTGIDFRGLNMTSFFLTETLNELGITPQIIRSGKYKSAIEAFTLTEMSPENKEQSELLLNNIWEQILNDIAANRNIEKKELNKIANTLLENWIINDESVLIDGQAYPQELSNLLNEKINIGTELNKFGLYDEKLSFVSLNDVLQSSKKNNNVNKIAIIYAEGEITDRDNGQISPKSHRALIQKVKEDENIKAVILRVNSPGGSALASDMIWYELEELKKVKPLIVSMGDVAASGGYYISCNANKIYASNNTITGSIGVFGLFLKIENLLKNKLKLHYDEINTNTYSNFGNPNKLFNKEEKEILGKLIDQTYETFLERVSNGRQITKEEVEKIAQGRIWSGKEAKNQGLVDEIGSLMDAIKYTESILQLENCQIVEYPKKKSVLEILFEDFQTNYKNHHKLSLLIKSAEKTKLLKLIKLIKDKGGIQTRIPVNIEIN